MKPPPASAGHGRLNDGHRHGVRLDHDHGRWRLDPVPAGVSVQPAADQLGRLAELVGIFGLHDGERPGREVAARLAELMGRRLVRLREHDKTSMSCLRLI